MPLICLACGEVIAQTGPVAAGSKYLGMDTKAAQLERDEDGDEFLTCPHCQAKNVIVNIDKLGEPRQFMIDHLKE